MFRFPTISSRPHWLWTVVALLAIVAVAASAAADEKSNAEDVDRFLSRLGLLDVQLLHAEKQLAKATGAEATQQLAGRLADLYAQRLMEIGDDTATYDDVMRRIKNLTTRHPSANTAALKVMLLQVDYNRAEKLVMQWVDNRGDKAALEEAAVILQRIAPELDRSWREIDKEIETLNRGIDALENEDAIAAKEQEVRRLQVVGNRAAYFAGWSNFYYGVSKQDRASAQPNFQAGRSAFRHIFELTEEDKYADVKPDWLGLESIYRSRSLMGLGMCEIALDNIAGAKACFEYLNDISAPLEIRDQGAAWFLLGLVQTNHWDEAVQFATDEVQKYSGGATKGKIQFCIALVLAEYGDAATSTPATKQLAKLGVTGLARLREFARLTQLMNKYDIQLGDDAGFYLTWLKGQRLFTEAEQTKDQETYAEAADVLQSALAQPDARQDLAAAGQCRFALGWAFYRLDKFEEAGKMFESAVLPLKAASDANAVKAAWLAFASFHRLASDDDRGVLLATSAAETLKKEFPQSSEAKRVDFHLAKLRQSGSSTADSIRRLSAIKPDDPNYLTAQYELCLLQHQQWTKSKDKPAAAKSAATATFAAVDQYLKVADQSDSALPMLKAGLLAVDIAMRTNDLAAQASSYLDQLKPLAESLPASSSSVAEYHYQRLQLARRSNDVPQQELHARWLVENSGGSPYERSAVIQLARAADAAVGSASPSESMAAKQQAAKVYARLVALTGSSAEAIASDTNARVANSKLAYYEYATGQYRQAAQRLESMLTADPKNKDYLHRAGLATFAAKDFAKSLTHWRTLVRGTKSGSDEWYEAKYHQMACLQKTDPEAGKIVYDQFKLLFPTVKSNAWKKKFEELDQLYR